VGITCRCCRFLWSRWCKCLKKCSAGCFLHRFRKRRRASGYLYSCRMYRKHFSPSLRKRGIQNASHIFYIRTRKSASQTYFTSILPEQQSLKFLIRVFGNGLSDIEDLAFPKCSSRESDRIGRRGCLRTRRFNQQSLLRGWI
jgi:hypothetical protein